MSEVCGVGVADINKFKFETNDIKAPDIKVSFNETNKDISISLDGIIYHNISVFTPKCPGKGFSVVIYEGNKGEDKPAIGKIEGSTLSFYKSATGKGVYIGDKLPNNFKKYIQASNTKEVIDSLSEFNTILFKIDSLGDKKIDFFKNKEYEKDLTYILSNWGFASGDQKKEFGDIFYLYLSEAYSTTFSGNLEFKNEGNGKFSVIDKYYEPLNVNGKKLIIPNY